MAEKGGLNPIKVGAVGGLIVSAGLFASTFMHESMVAGGADPTTRFNAAVGIGALSATALAVDFE